ncbi:MAG: phosphate ABC transporter substrate-binding protein PstS [Bacteroidales bacterium]|nr:phosphate ABC transporter substrate-binding protein PstS [Bacteroidales bacterium]
MKHLSIKLSAIAMATLMAMGCNNNENTASVSCSLSGAGATFPEPFYSMAFDNYATKSGNTVNYGGIGSGGGVRNLKDMIVDFAGSDAYLSDDEMAEMEPVVHVPTCMGAVVLGVNLPEVKEVRLSGEVVADIFAGKITKWNDARVCALNPLTKLPNKAIVPVFRSDGSGTTFVFTTYLSQVNEAWSRTYGAAKSVDFPVGQAAKGNPGVASVVSQTPYSIGYIGSEYAFAQQLPMAVMQNARGEFVSPSVESISAAAKGDLPSDTRTMITNSDAKGSYPISCFTWLIVYQEQHYADRSIDQAKATVDLLKFMLSDANQQAAPLVGYAPLPKSMVKTSLENIKKITYDGQSL